MHSDVLKGRIRDCIHDPAQPIWFPSLTKQLVETGWATLKNEFDLEPSNYGTTRILANELERTIFDVPCESVPFTIELLPKDLVRQYSDHQMDFYCDEELSQLRVLDCLAEAVKIIGKVPSLWEAVLELVRSLHLIRLEDDAYDVSFSEPTIPFSIFISVPKNRVQADYLRVAEALVHEAMHLQLTLIDKALPLIRENNAKLYSPWKEEFRTPGGIVHAMYVFRSLDHFLSQIAQFESRHADYISNRRKLILEQIGSVEPSNLFRSLTASGRVLVQRLISDKI